jgi:hypothetical protein
VKWHYENPGQYVNARTKRNCTRLIKKVTCSRHDIAEILFCCRFITHYKNLSRELSCFIQVHSDFVGAATRGAMAVIDGNVMAINPGEDAK